MFAGGSGPVATSATGSLSACDRCHLQLLRRMSRQKLHVCNTQGSVPTEAMQRWPVQERTMKHGRVRPDDFVCQTVEEVIEWMDARQSGRHGECCRSQQVGSFGRGSVTVEELDSESIVRDDLSLLPLFTRLTCLEQ